MNVPDKDSVLPTVLVVEDDADLRAYLAHSLRELGQVAEAADGLDALAVLAARPVALIVTDLLMPRMGGSALCRAMQTDPALAAIPVLIITGESSSDIPGACGTLVKPFNARVLKQRAAPYLRTAIPSTPPAPGGGKSGLVNPPSTPLS